MRFQSNITWPIIVNMVLVRMKTYCPRTSAAPVCCQGSFTDLSSRRASHHQIPQPWQNILTAYERLCDFDIKIVFLCVFIGLWTVCFLFTSRFVDWRKFPVAYLRTNTWDWKSTDKFCTLMGEKCLMFSRAAWGKTIRKHWKTLLPNLV